MIPEQQKVKLIESDSNGALLHKIKEYGLWKMYRKGTKFQD